MTKGPGRDFAKFSLVLAILRLSPTRELGIELFLGCWKEGRVRVTSGRRVMRIMEGQGVDGHGGDTSPKRNAFARVCENVSFFSLLFSLCRVLSCLVLSCPVLSCLVLSCLVGSCLVLSCGVCVCVCWCARVLACKTLPAVSLRRAGVQQLYQVQRMIGGIGNVLFSTCSQTLNV